MNLKRLPKKQLENRRAAKVAAKAPLTAVGCSIYAGLFTLGVKRAGFKVTAHLEQDAYGTDTAIANHPELDIYIGKDTWPDQLDPKPDFIFCNPPCAVWSQIGGSWFGQGAGSHWRDDPRLQHAYDALELVDRFEPQVWAWESVPMALTRGRPMLMEMAEYGSKRGYATTVLCINAMYLGVPQDRPRVFVVLHKVAFDPWPCDYDYVMTVAEAWKGLPKKGPYSEFNRCTDSQVEVLKWMTAKKMGGKASMRNAFTAMRGDEIELNERGQVKGRPAIADKRLALDEPGRPMLAKSFHPTEPRYLTVGEAMRICQVPDDWQFGPSAKGIDARKCLLQRAVMPGVGEWLAKAVAKAIRRGEPVDSAAPALVRDLRAREEAIYPLGTGYETQGTKANGARGEPKATRVRNQAPKPPREPRKPPNEAALDKARRVCQNLTKGSGARIRSMILQGGLTDDAIVTKILAEFPDHKTTKSDVSWNRGMLRKAGLLK